MPWWLLLTIDAAQAAPASASVARPAERAVTPVLSILPHCRSGALEDEVVVCASPRDRYRLPLPVARDPVERRAPGEAPGGSAALAGVAPCGIFAGERRCTPRDAAAFGYGRGRDPLSVAARLAKRLAGAEPEPAVVPKP